MDKNVITATELLNKGITKIPFLLDGVYPKTGLATLGGSSDTGKSTLARQLAMSIVSEEKEFLGYQLNTEHKRALYVSTEDDETATGVVINNQQSYFGCTNESFERLSFIFRTDNLLKRIETELEKAPHDLVVIDAFADLFGGDINQVNQVRNYLDGYSQLAQEYNCLFLFIHHSGKNTEYKVPSKNNLLGSQVFEGKMRTVVLLVKDKTDVNKRFLCLVKGNYLKENMKTEGTELVFNSNLTFEATGKTLLFEEMKKDENRESRNKKAIELSKNGIRPKEIAKILGCSESTVQRALKGSK